MDCALLRVSICLRVVHLSLSSLAALCRHPANWLRKWHQGEVANQSPPESLVEGKGLMAPKHISK